jgi:predicted AlkP superfamily pyrophosphatase or phosphodiesterase
VNCDGLGADWVQPALVPTIAKLMSGGASMGQYRAVFPSVTRVSAASIATGCRPANHGLQGNRMALVEDGRLRVHDVGPPGFFAHLRKITGRTLHVPVLAERLQQDAGFIAFSNVSPGAATALDPNYHGFVYHRAGSFAPGGAAITGRDHLAVTHDCAGDLAMTQRFCREVMDERRPTVAVLWLANPDLTLHAHPLGSPEHVDALKVADSCVAQVIDAVDKARRAGDDVLLIVGSDHGQETIGHGVSVSDWLAEHGLRAELEDGRVAVASQGTSALLYALPQARPLLEQVLPAMASEPWAGTVHDADTLAALGHLAGSLVAAIDFARDPRPNPYGVAGHRYVSIDGEKPAAVGFGQHGGRGPDESRPFLVLDHPAIAAGVDHAPASLIDVAPTILAFLGLPRDGMDGRALTTFDDPACSTNQSPQQGQEATCRSHASNS